MRCFRLFLCLALLISAACSNSSYEMPRASLGNPELIPEVVLYPGLPHRVGPAEHPDKFQRPLAVCEDPEIVGFEEDDGVIFALGLKPGRTLIRHPREDGDMATKIRVEGPKLLLPQRNDIPRYLRGHCNPATFAHAVNHYVRMGEARACRQLLEASELSRATGDYFDRRDMACHISDLCRGLFQGTPQKPLRASFQGAGMLPYQSMRAKLWPLLPLVEQDGVFLELSAGPRLIAGGLPEPIEDYLRYCKKEGTFRKRPVKVPGRAEALAAAEALFQSGRWVDLREEAARRGEVFSEAFIQEGVRVQARSIY